MEASVQDLDPEEMIHILNSKLDKYPELCSFEGYCKWFAECKNYLTATEMTKEINKLIQMDEIAKEPTDFILETDFTSTISMQIKMMFFQTIFGTSDDYQKYLKLAKSTLENYRRILKTDGPHYKELGHLQGAIFVLQSVSSVQRILHGKEEEIPSLTEMMKFSEIALHEKSKAFVYLLKVLFTRNYLENQAEQLLNEAIMLDDHWEYHLMKYKTIRWERKFSRNCDQPLEPEQEAIEKAYSLCPGHPAVLLRVCQFLAQVINRAYSNSKNRIASFPFKISDKTFKNGHEIIAFLKSNALDFLEKEMYGNWLNEWAKIFSGDLPKNFRDRKLSKQFLERAIKISPTSSQCNHRMAIFFAQEQNFSEAETYLKNAVEFNPNNLPALFDLAKLLLRDANKNYQSLSDIFKEDTTSQRVEYQNEWLFFKGYFNFVNGHEDAALVCWSQWIENGGHNKTTFKELVWSKNLWRWSHFDLVSQFNTIKEIVSRKMNLYQTLVKVLDEDIQYTLNPSTW